MKILVIGSGGREHALVDRLASDPSVTALLCAPGNPGIAARAACRPLSATDVDALVSLAVREGVSLVVVGPEAPLALGLADRLGEQGVPVFGPTAAAARLETSKVFAKDFMARHRIPTAGYAVCRSVGEAKLAVERLGGAPVVIKADGLAAGKGVVVALTPEEASDAIDAALVGRAFGAAGETLVVEEFLEGNEASFFAICDGRRAVAAGSAQDHKRALDDDLGPNTGGMGAFAPSPLIDADTADRVLSEIVEPVIGGMRAEGCPFVGFLYVGLMMTAQGPKVVEFNVRFGDPEAQVVFPLMDGELAPVLLRAARGELAGEAMRFVSRVAVGVVMASGGYPGLIDVGKPITGIERAAARRDVRVYHAGTALRDGRLVTAGGRVLTVVARADTYRDAIDDAYAAVDEIAFDRAHVRRDIGRRALQSPGEAATR